MGGGDALIELEVTANRPDCLSALGLAYELSAATGVAVKPPQTPSFKVPGALEASVADPALCPRYTLRAVRGVTVGPASAALAARLAALGQKPISNVVDVTNDLLFELGQPLHAFDADALKGPLQVRMARAGERLRTLDGVDRALTPEVLVIADAERPVAVAGVMGGMDTAVTPATRNVLLESAVFDPGAVRRSARLLKLATDSSYRFERGVDPEGVVRARDLAVAAVLKEAGGEAGPAVEVGAAPPRPSPFVLRRARLAALLGMEVPAVEVSRILRGLGCEVADMPEGWRIQAPSRRGRDLRIEAEAVEEVARVWGYDRLPSRITMTARAGRPDPARALAGRLSEGLRAAGFHEALTTSFVEARALTLRPLPSTGAPLALRNPMSADQTHLRVSLLPGLLASLAHNQSVGEGDGRLFETGRVYAASADARLPAAESWVLALAAAMEPRALRGVLEAVLGPLGLAMAPAEGPVPGLEEGTALALTVSGIRVGAAGVLASAEAKAVDLRHAPAVAELLLEPLLAATGGAARFHALPRFPAVDRDLAVVVDEAVTWERVREAVASVPCAFRESVRFFDLYRGKQAGPGKKSLAFSVRFRHPERTLAGDEVDAVMALTVTALERGCGAAIRR